MTLKEYLFISAIFNNLEVCTIDVDDKNNTQLLYKGTGIDASKLLENISEYYKLTAVYSYTNLVRLYVESI